MKTLAVFMAVLLYSVTLSSQERITLLFVGDLMQHQAQIDAARVSEGKYDSHWGAGPIGAILCSAPPMNIFRP